MNSAGVLRLRQTSGDVVRVMSYGESLRYLMHHAALDMHHFFRKVRLPTQTYGLKKWV